MSNPRKPQTKNTHKKKAISNHISSNAIYYPTQSDDLETPEDSSRVYASQPASQANQMISLNIMPSQTMGCPTQVYGREEADFYCKACKKKQRSEVLYEVGTGSWIWAFGCLVLCCCASPFAFCCESLQDAVHKCPDCRQEVGRSRFLFS